MAFDYLSLAVHPSADGKICPSNFWHKSLVRKKGFFTVFLRSDRDKKKGSFWRKCNFASSSFFAITSSHCKLPSLSVVNSRTFPKATLARPLRCCCRRRGLLRNFELSAHKSPNNNESRSSRFETSFRNPKSCLIRSMIWYVHLGDPSGSKAGFSSLGKSLWVGA